MAKKIFALIIIGVIVLAIAGGVYLFLQKGKGGVGDVTETSDDGMATLSATFYDFSGTAPSSGVSQALVGGTSKQTHVKFEMKASNTGNVELTNINLASPNANMNGAFDNVGSLATLAVGASNIIVGSTDQICVINEDCDANEECIGTPLACYIKLDDYTSANAGVPHNVDFSVSLSGSYLDALGIIQTATSDPVSLQYDLRGEACDEGTSILSCVFDRTGIDGDKPNYCNFVEGTAPSIIEKSSVCGCPEGFEPDGLEGCQQLTCSDGTLVNSCSTVTHEGTYGAWMYCDSSLNLVADCNGCSATNDAYGNPKTGCNP